MTLKIESLMDRSTTRTSTSILQFDGDDSPTRGLRRNASAIIFKVALDLTRPGVIANHKMVLINLTVYYSPQFENRSIEAEILPECLSF